MELLVSWFRLHDRVLDDPKVAKLSDSLFRYWVKILSLANRHKGSLPHDLRDVAYALRVSERKARGIIDDLINASLLDECDAQLLRPHDWDDWQYQSDTSTKRVQRFRERKRNVSVTPPDTEQNRAETETEHKTQDLLAIELLPDWVPVQAFENFVEMRRKIKKPLTEHAKELAIKDLARLRDEGESPEAVLNQSTFRCYQGLFPVKQEQKDARGTSKAERRNADISKDTREVFNPSRGNLGDIPKSLSAKASS